MENQKTKIISIVSLIALALTLVTATFAYFMAQTGEGKSTDIKINASTVDTFTFATGSALSLNLNQQNFASGAGNQTGTTYAKAMLTANNKTNTATEHYNLYLGISENTFTYTQDTNTPEILLTIKDASNNEITSITGLEYKTVTDGKGASISGFDITTKSGLVTLFDNREITTTSSITEQWNIIVTFVNYNADQSANAGKGFDGKILIQKEKITPLSINDVKSYILQHNDELTLHLRVDATANIGKVSDYYYSIDDGETFEVGDSSYIRKVLEDTSPMSIVVYATDTNGNKSDPYSFSITPEKAITLSEPSTKIEKRIIEGYSSEEIDACVISFDYTSKYDIGGCHFSGLDCKYENNVLSFIIPKIEIGNNGVNLNWGFWDNFLKQEPNSVGGVMFVTNDCKASV